MNGSTGKEMLSTAKLSQLKPGLRLLEPLSRRGRGPGMIVLVPDTGVQRNNPLDIQEGIPSIIMKWAEEGYVVAEVSSPLEVEPDSYLRAALEGITQCESFEPNGLVGLVAYDPKLWNAVSAKLSTYREIVAAVAYGDADPSNVLNAPSVPWIKHLAGKSLAPAAEPDASKAYCYPATESYLFASPFQKLFHYANESVSHTRNLTFLKKHMNGPYFDLEAIWDEHTKYEFGVRSVPETMATMVEEPYVNHVPTLTGGIGRKDLSYFYEHHFIFNNPDDTELELISRTVGVDRVVDEMIFNFTHDKVIDWLIPGIPPTHRRVEVPLVAIVNIRGDKLYHEHIIWDQASVLVQLGLMPEHLPYPYEVPNRPHPSESRNVEFRVPAAGVETANKVRNKNSVASNMMFKFSIR